MTAPSIVENVTCLGCGCVCDDIGVVVRDGRIVEARNACNLGVQWFGDGELASKSLVNGRHLPLTEAISAAATSLRDARRPLVYLAPGLSCEAYRAAIAIADMLRARVDSTTSSTAAAFVLFGQERGLATATLGEIRNRADVLLFWAIDLERRYPRFASRYAPEPAGLHVEGRRSRTVIAVDVDGATSTIAADRRLTIRAADELATLTAVGALTRDSADASSRYASLRAAPWDTARELAPLLLAGRYVGLVYDTEPDDRAERSPQRFDALASLAQSLNERTRCAAVPIRGGGNRSGADVVFVAQTGYPFAVDFTRGYPRYDPHASSACAVLQRREADAILFVGDAMAAPRETVGALSAVRTVAIGPWASALSLGTESIALDTGRDGIHASGTAFRTDDVPLPLRAVLLGAPRAVDIIRAVSSAVAESVLTSVSRE